MTPERVFDGDLLRAVLIRGRSERLVVTFDYRRDGREGFSADTHSTSFARQGFSQLAIKTRANDWFVNAETPALEAAVERVARTHARVQALGFSMGGYGALRFARALGLSRRWSCRRRCRPLAPLGRALLEGRRGLGTRPLGGLASPPRRGCGASGLRSLRATRTWPMPKRR
jgi:hypothetical protein